MFYLVDIATKIEKERLWLILDTKLFNLVDIITKIEKENL